MNLFLIFASAVLIYLYLMWKAGKTFPIMELFFFTYFLQYIFSTYLIYNQYSELGEQMPISQIQYFNYTLPAFVFLFFGVFIFKKDYDLRGLFQKINGTLAVRMAYLLLAISYGFDLGLAVGLSFLGSIVSFTSYLKYVAAFSLVFTNSRFNYAVIFFVYAQLVVFVLRNGVFIDFFIWTTYLFFILSLKYRISFVLRSSFILIAAPVLIMVQSVKDEYREATWNNSQEAGIGLFTDLAQQNQNENNSSFVESEGVVSTVGRLTQGWHLAKTLKWVPKKAPFENGNEMFSDIFSSILPRIIFTEKKTVGAQDKFFKYTGHKLQKGTSMTIGVLGDFYINFGFYGSFVMLFVFGALIAKLLRFFIEKYVLKNPLHLIWIPYLLNYLVRANNDFYMVFNNMVKGFLIFLLVNYLVKRFWPQYLEMRRM